MLGLLQTYKSEINSKFECITQDTKTSLSVLQSNTLATAGHSIVSSSLPLKQPFVDSSRDSWSLNSQFRANDYKNLKTATQGIVGSIGMVGNGLSAYVLSSASMRSTFNHLLIVLAVTDNLFILLTVLDYTCARGGQYTSYRDGQFINLLF